MQGTPKEIIKSLSDQRQYLSLTLENKIQCLIIRDQDAELSSAALSMGVGSFKDPRTSQGIAHYLQHMLFMGTEKYPDENDYSEYITKYSGSNNAYTSQQETNYHLQITSNAFEGALDRFAQFFISPLMSESSSARELNAVNSEHAKNILNDSWRKYNLSKHISKPDSPFNKFSTGNIESLKNDNLPKILRDFYDENYSANLMKLVIYGRQDMQVLKKWAIQKFSPIPNKNLTRFQLPECPFDDRALGKMFKIVPIKDKKKLQLNWILSNQRDHYRNHPGKYVSHLIGHQGKGSLLSLLSKEDLVTSLSAGSYDNYNVYCEFSVTMDLTDIGMANIHKIIAYTLFYIENIKKNGIQEWIFKQIQLINKIKFDFMDKKKGMMNTAKIAKSLHTRKMQEINIQPYLMEEWKPQLVQKFLSEMTINNLIVFVESKQFQAECHLEQPIYGTKYSESPIGQVLPLECQIGLPQKNIFIPTDLTVIPLSEKQMPKQIFNSTKIQFFFKADHEFSLPKVNIALRMYFKGSNSVRQDILRTLLIDMLKEDLRQFAYLAETAQIEASVNFVCYYGLEIKLKGFRDSLMKFLNEYIKRILDYIPDNKQLFETLRAKNKRKFANYFLEDPYRLVYDQQICAIRSGSSVPAEEKVSEINLVTLEDVAQFSKNWKSSVFVEGYIGGNIHEESAKGLVANFNQLLEGKVQSLAKEQVECIRTVQIPQNNVCIIEKSLANKKEDNCAICVHFQGTQSNHKSEMMIKILQSVAKQPAFDYLRTKEQLGYIVFCMSEDHRGVEGLTIIVQSSVKTSYEVRGYINIFINEKLKQILKNMTEQDFETYKQSLLNAKTEKDKNLAAETTRYWSQIVKHKYIFNRKQLELDLIPTINFAEFQKYVQTLIYDSPRRMEIHVNPDKSHETNQKVKQQQLGTQQGVQVFSNYQAFAKKMKLLPDFYAIQ